MYIQHSYTKSYKYSRNNTDRELNNLHLQQQDTYLGI